MIAAEVGPLVADLFRRESGRIVARLLRRLGPSRLQLAEDIAQATLLRALDHWPWRGVPDDPAAWLHAVAHRLAIDAIRRAATERRLDPLLKIELARAAVADPVPVDTDGIPDDELRLLFLCADPALTPDMRVPLMLNIACGFTAAEIARGLLRETAAVAQTLVRAKRLLRAAERLPELPDPGAPGDRLAPTIDALHLMFSEGYEASAGDTLSRAEICREALRLAELLASHATTGTPQVLALAALFCFQAARLDSRSDAEGTVVLLQAQDRSLWNRELIGRGWRYLDRAGKGAYLTEHHLLAAIAAEHVRAPSFEHTDWRALLDWYDLLVAVAPTPIHRLNRAVVLAQTHGAEAALAAIDGLASIPALARYHLHHATRGEMLRRLGRTAEAASSFETALSLAPGAAARRHLQRRIEGLRDMAGP